MKLKTAKKLTAAASNLLSPDRVVINSLQEENNEFMEPNVANENDALQQQGDITRNEMRKKYAAYGKENPCNIQSNAKKGNAGPSKEKKIAKKRCKAAVKERLFLEFERDRGDSNDTTRKEAVKNKQNKKKKVIEPSSVIDEDMDESHPINVEVRCKTDDLNDKGKEMDPKPAVQTRKRECALDNDQKKRELDHLQVLEKKGQKGKFVALKLAGNQKWVRV